MTDQQPRLFRIWLDASDGSIASYDGVQWPDGTADVHHRHRRPDGVQWTPQALAEQIHGKQARIEWAPDHGPEQRERAEHAEAQVARIRAFLEDMAGWCSPHGVAADYARRGLDALDGIDPLGVATPATQVSEPRRTGWLDVAKETLLAAEAKAKAETPATRELGESLAFAMDALLPGAEPMFCHHENATRSSHTTMQAGWGRKTVHTVSCPACPARAESTEGEPVLAPYLLNASRCTKACTEQHTARPGCLLAPDFSKPILPTPATGGEER